MIDHQAQLTYEYHVPKERADTVSGQRRLYELWQPVPG